MDACWMSKKNLIATLLAGLIAGAALFLAVHKPQAGPVAVGDLAPDFTLPSLDSRTLTLRDYRRQVVILNFWATWCPPCVEEAPSLEAFAESTRGQGVTVIGVSVDQNVDELREFVSRHRLSFAIARDPEQALASRFGTSKFPETYILDRDGKVAEKIIGPIDWQDPRMLSFVHALAGIQDRQGL
jgi:peroxiredoxin